MATLKAIPGGQGSGAVTSGVEPYGLTPEFERALIYLCCRNRDVYARVGARLDPKALSSKVGVQLLKAAQAIGAELGEGPTSILSVIQRLRAWREEGKVTIEQVQEANEYLDEAEDAGLPDPAEVVTEVANLLKKRAKREVVKKALDVMAKGGDFQKLGAEIAATERIGESRTTLGETLHDSLIDEIVAANSVKRLPTGCLELDGILGGGLPLGYSLFLGREKSGKSMVLTSVAAEALWRGENVAIATLELDAKKQLERIIANLTTCLIDEVQRGDPLVRRRLAQLKLGKVAVMRFAPDTPVGEITRWVERVQQEWQAPLHLLVVDYVDLVGSGKNGKDEGDYKAQKTVGNSFRDHALNHNYHVISASQGKRGTGTAGKPLDMDDAADSQHKVRIADLVVAMRMEPDAKDMIDWYIILNRDGTDRVGTGDLPAARAMARMFPTNRQEPW